MPKFTVQVWETRAYWVPVEADDEDDAKEIASEDYITESTRDEFVSVEVREIEKAEVLELTMTERATLETHVKSAVSMGCTHADRMLGIQKMPAGYALMLDADDMHFFWLRKDGAESSVHWSKWAVRRGAVADAKLRSDGERTQEDGK